VASNKPLGRIYLPTASYQEMMGWALPAGVGDQYEHLIHRVEEMPNAGSLVRFVHGGVWHNFFHKYDEANHLHKRMLDLSRRFRDLDQSLPRSADARRRYNQGYDCLLSCQCNDAYWHGVFGGLYAPHLRTSLYESLLQAESAADDLDAGPRRVQKFDLNVDGADEIVLSNKKVTAIIATGDGGTAAEIDFKPRSFNAVNSLRRRPETYHSKLRQGPHEGAGTAVSIHDRVRSKEPGLDRHLHYDRYNRSCFRSMVFSAGRTLEDYRLGRLEESLRLAGGTYEVLHAEADRCTLAASDGSAGCRVSSTIAIDAQSISSQWTLEQSGLAEIEAGLELVLNLLAPDAHDRYFVLPDSEENPKGPELRRPRLSWSGEVRGGTVRLVDEWLGVEIEVMAAPAARWWILPIYTVSQSEGGFEKVYQGSCLLPHWAVEGGELRAAVTIRFKEI
jgi:alpha-amylase